MATWVRHTHGVVSDWVNAKSRAGYAGLRQSFDAACVFAEDDTHWTNRADPYAYVVYNPSKHPMVFPLVLKIRIEPLCIIVVGVAMTRERLGFKVP